MADCPIKGLVGRASSLKKADLQVHLLFSPHRGESWQAGQVPVTARKDDAAAADQAATSKVAVSMSAGCDGGLIQTTPG